MLVSEGVQHLHTHQGGGTFRIMKITLLNTFLQNTDAACHRKKRLKMPASSGDLMLLKSSQ